MFGNVRIVPKDLLCFWIQNTHPQKKQKKNSSYIFLIFENINFANIILHM